MSKNTKSTPSKQLTPINYEKIIDDYNEGAFKLCVKQLFPLFELQVLKAEEIRPADLKEHILTMTQDYCRVSDGQSNLSTLLYSTGLRYLFDAMVKPLENSRAHRYNERALELLTQAADGIKIMQSIEDALLIFVALMKPLQHHNLSKSKSIEEPDFSLRVEDIEIFRVIWAASYEAFNTKKHRLFKKKSVESDAMSYYTFCYINNVLFFCRILQERGLFTTEEE